MAYQFDAHWSDVIAAETGKSEYQQAEIQIIDTTVVPEYDVITGEYTYPPGYDPEIYVGQARLIFPRWGVFTGGESQNNAKTNNVVRVQLPQNALRAVVARGHRFKVVSAPKNPALIGRFGTITSDVQGSSAATRTFEASWDGDQPGPGDGNNQGG